MKNLITPLLMATALIATACTNTNDDDVIVDPSEKTPISFSGEENSTPITRAGFTVETKVAIRIKSTDGTSSSKFSHVVATAEVPETGKDYSKVSLAETRYWDDAYGRKANLSVYAIAVPGKTDVKNNGKGVDELLAKGDATWFTEDEENEKVSWQVTTVEQSESTLNDEDLTYSNNISASGKGGAKSYCYEEGKVGYTITNDGVLKFRLKDDTKTDGPGKFDQGRLKFNHALCRITINLTKGAGFGDNAFDFASGTNVTINNVPTSGTLDLATGSWDATSSNITKMYQKETVAHESYSLMAQFLPGYVINANGDTGVLTFSIDGNNYTVTQSQMYTALNKAIENRDKMTKLETTKVTMEEGINYVFNITVNKTGVDMTATIVDFTDVTSDTIEPSNAVITLSLKTPSGTGDVADTSFDLYRLLDSSNSAGNNWKGDYTEKVTCDDSNHSGNWNTGWYFANNQSYYHFRTVKKDTPVTFKDVDDYFSITSGKVDETDYLWGAPMTTDPSYDITNGYTACINPAIGATKNVIAITELHMLSKIQVELSTTTSGDNVTLDGNTKVYITNFAKDGTVLMGTGLVTPTATLTDLLQIECKTTGTVFAYAVVPQALDNVGLKIVTGDGNEYYINGLSSIKDDKNNTISRWIPGHSYTYKFTLKKSGIADVTCTIVDYVDVTTGNTDVTL